MSYQNYDEQLYIEVQKLLIGNYDMCKSFTNLSADFVYKILYDTVGEFLAKKNSSTKTAVMDELLKEAYIQIFNNISNLREPRAFYMWATNIVTGIALKYIQKNNFEIISFEDEVSNKNITFNRACDDKEAFLTETVINDKSKLLVIHRKIMELSDLHHVVAQYFYYANMSIKDISVAMNCSEGAVKSRINDIRNVIKVVIRDEEQDEEVPTKELKNLGEVPLVWMAFRESIATFQDKQAIQRAHYISDVVGTNATKKGISDDAIKVINKTLGVDESVTAGRIIEAPEKKGHKVLSIILVIVLVILAGGIFGIWLKSRENNSKKDDASVSTENSTEENSLQNNGQSDSTDVEITEEASTEESTEEIIEETSTEETTEVPTTEDNSSAEEGVPNSGEGDITDDTPDSTSETTEGIPVDGEDNQPVPEGGNQSSSSNNLDENADKNVLP